MEHFQWLVRYQIQNWSLNDIADFYSTKDKILSEDTVRKALLNTARIVELEIRK